MELSFDLSPDLIIAFLTLFVLEIVLGVDNVIFISILAGKLPAHQQAKARNLGLTLAMLIRIGLLFAAAWIISLKSDLFTLFGMGFSGRDLILIFGGLFLVYKAVHEIHEKLEGADEHAEAKPGTAAFRSVIIQILLLDIVFSFDSIITAVGMVDNLLVIILAVVLSFGVMLFAAKYIFAFVNRHPTVKMLALSFLVMIGAFLIADGFDVHVSKALIYGPIAFAIVVEALNLTYKKRQDARTGAATAPVHLHQQELGAEAEAEFGTETGTPGGTDRPATPAG